MARAVAAVARRRRRAQHRLVADPVVPRQGRRHHLLLLLAPRDAAAAALRPVHGAGLEGSHPASLVWIMIVAAFRELTNEGRTRLQTLAYVGIPLALVVLVASFFGDNKAVQREEETTLEPMQSAYPVPVLSGGPPVHDVTAHTETTEVLGD